MKIFCKIAYLRYIGVSVIIGMLSAGCIGNFSKTKNELALKNSEMQTLSDEKNELVNEIELLKRDEMENARIREVAEEALSSTGITVRTKSNGNVALMLPSTSFFATGRADLKKSAKTHLRRISSLLNQKFYDKIIRIEGHTDNQPIQNKKNKYKTNWELSVARAISVLHYFTKSCGVSPSNLYVAGFAENEPVVSNSDKYGRNENRRVEIVIIP